MANTVALNLEQLRKKNGVSLEKVSEQTRIGTNYLRAIESEEFDKLPGGVFSTSYIRQYAGAIGCSADELLARYRDKVEAAEQEQQTCTSPAPSGIRSYVNWLRLPSPLFRS